MQLSVIILNYNVRYFLETCILSVKKAITTLNAEIIVVDNNSSDNSCQMIKNRFPDVKLIVNNYNTGFPTGNNIGVKAAIGNYICILNPDTVVAEDTFTKILHFLQHNEHKLNIGIVGCKLIDGNGTFLPESKRGIPTPWVAFTKILGLYKIWPNSTHFNRYYAQHLTPNQSGKVDILVGAFMFLKRSLYNDIGGFDENCFMYSDDIDLSYQALLKNKINYYFHNTTVIHYKGESTVKDAQYMKRFQDAMHFFHKKHFKVPVLFSFFMKIGIVLFSLIKMLQQSSKKKIKPQHYIIQPHNNTLKRKIEKKIQQNNLNIKLNKRPKQTQMILNLNFMSFKKAIAIFEQKKNNKIVIKLLPPNSNFIIGSSTSNDRGEVLVF